MSSPEPSRTRQRRLAGRRIDHRVPALLQHAADDLPQGVLVLRNQDAQRPGRDHGFADRRRRGATLNGKPDRARTGARLAVRERQGAPAAGNDPPEVLQGLIEGARRVALVGAGRAREREADVLPGGRLSCRLRLRAPHLQSAHASLPPGDSRQPRQREEHVAGLTAVEQDLDVPSPVLDRDFQPHFATERGQKGPELFSQPPPRQQLRQRVDVPVEGQQLLGQQRGALTRGEDLLHIRTPRVVFLHVAEEHLAVPQYRGQEVVEVVREHARQPADSRLTSGCIQLLVECGLVHVPAPADAGCRRVPCSAPHVGPPARPAAVARIVNQLPREYTSRDREPARRDGQPGRSGAHRRCV